MSLLDKASLIVTPNAVKESKLYSVVPSSGAGDMDVVRATTATRVNSAGLIEVVPRNLFTYSQQFDNADWEKDGVTVTANTTTAPNGTLTADKINETTATSSHLVRNLFTGTGTTTISVFAKKAERDYIVIYSSGGSLGAYFDLNTGTALGIIGSCTSNIQSVGNGWYRCSITFSLTGLAYAFIGVSSLGNNVSYTGTAGYGVYLWGAQSESFGSTTEYFPTTTRLNIPRIDYTNGSCPSLLVEPQRTNLLTYSEQLDNAAWGAPTNVIPNAIISPDGTQNADNLIGLLARNVLLSNTNYTLSFYAKKNTSSTFQMRVDIGGIKRAYYNFDTQTSTNDGISSSIKPIGNNWFLCTFTFASSIIATGVLYPNEASSNLYMWGVQLEAGSYATSYIPTVASSVTRNADVISKTGISSLIGQTEGTIFLDFIYNHNDFDVAEIISISDESTANRVYIGNVFDDNLTCNITTTSSIQFTATTAFALVVGQRYKAAVSYKLNDFTFYVNGSQIATDNSGTVPLMSKLGFDSGAGGSPFYKPTNSVQLYKTRLTNSELISLTTL